MPKTNFMPDKAALENKAPKVVVFTLDESSNEVAKNAGLGSSLANSIESALAKDKVAQLVDRNANKKLKQEIMLAESNKTGAYKGPQVADYAISGTIANASFTKRYTEATSYVDKTGHIVRIPAKYSYHADVSGSIKIYQLPSLTVASNIDFNGRAGRSEDVQSNGGMSVQGLVHIAGQKAAAENRDDNMIRKAGQSAIDDIVVNIENFFAQKGYILEKRVRNDKAIFKISIGSADGVKQGDALEVSSKFEDQNPLTEKTEIEQRLIATGVVADKIYPNSAWIIIDDKKKAESIRLGDIVQIKYKKNYFHSVSKTLVNSIE